MSASAPVDPGATPTAARALAPDLARGGMLLLIALANVHVWGWGHAIGVRGYPQAIEGADRWVALVQMTLVDGRAYPLFGFLFGYGVVQLAERRNAVGIPRATARTLVRRRGFWMILIGAAHGILLWPGDIIGAYGLLAVIMAGLLVRGEPPSLLVTAVVGVVLTGIAYAGSGLQTGEQQAFLPSMSVADPAGALIARATEWATIGLFLQALLVFGAVALGAWSARQKLLDEPERHRALLVRVATIGLSVAVLFGLPMALMASRLLDSPPVLALLLAGTFHAVGGYAGGVGYAALFGLLAARLSRLGRSGHFVAALQACGQRSMSCYLAQSIAFVILFPAWTLGLGQSAHLWQLALAGVGTWLVILVVAAATARAGMRGPAEVLLRRLTYGQRTSLPGR